MKTWIRFMRGSFVWLALIVAAAACSPPPTVDREAIQKEVEQQIEAPADPESDDEAAESVSSPPLTVSDEIQTTAAGIQVGFTEDGHAYMGDPNAPVRIEEYSDYQCPFCARFVNDTMGSIKDDAVANGEVVLVFYDFPLPIHPQGVPAAEAARCAGEASAEAYWAMHDALFESVRRWSIDNPTTVFISMAEEIGIDTDDFASCLEDDRYDDAISADISAGQQAGVTGTPTFFLNGEPLVGALPLQAFQQAITAVLAGESIARAEPEPAPLPDPDDLDIPPFEMPQPLVATEDYAAVMGDPAAPILIVEYTDYQCPYCSRHSATTMPVIIQQMVDSGRVRYAIKDLPLDSIHPQARAAAVAARCAGEQDRYWDMHDQLFFQQQTWPASADLNQGLTGIAVDLGLEEELFATCLASGRYDDAIQANFNEAAAFGITGTPAFIIGGYSISGAQPFDIFELVVTNLEDGTIEQLFRSAYDEQVAAYRAQIAQERAAQLPVDVPIAESFSVGDPDAPVVIVEYTDFQCPYCGRHFEQTYPQLKEAYIDTGLVRYVFKDYPLDFHLQAPRAAEAARCANEQGEFLAMHNKLFTQQSSWAGKDDVDEIFIGIATELSLDEEAFSDCLTENRYASAVQADYAEGASFGITGTPTFFINGNRVVGAVPFDVFAQAIDSILAEQ